ncbi:sensor domain-containing diguanylate cyclase [Anaerosporobacter sp.]|uniref:sensor domain-containing diguanylate cyclase n=1 Tax=Anaerosporobacter sp. TaxID=1872529 RepID=UPI00286F04DA|nr:sensor domain-containing diguanylate cyclase [Anaerosporobacter sp.]
MKKISIMSIAVIFMTMILIIFTTFITVVYDQSISKELDNYSINIDHDFIRVVFILECLILFVQICYYIINSQMNAKLLIEKEKYTTILKHTHGVLWEYDIKTDILKKSNKDNGLHLGSDHITHYLSQSFKDDIIHPDDKNTYEEFCNHLKSGKKEIHTMFRSQDVSGEYVWFEIVGVTLYRNNVPITVIGTTTNIDKQQKEYELLKQHAEEDPLTKLYNRATAEAKINSIIENSDSHHIHAFCMIDIDDFKSLNDNLGHTFGDTVLIEFSSKLDALLAPNDFAFRIGGDEFAVFLNDIPSVDYAQNVSKQICSIFNNLLVEEERSCDISGSLGISLYPNHGSTFEELFALADVALYHSKGLGKDCYSLYSNVTMG